MHSQLTESQKKYNGKKHKQNNFCQGLMTQNQQKTKKKAKKKHHKQKR